MGLSHLGMAVEEDAIDDDLLESFTTFPDLAAIELPVVPELYLNQCSSPTAVELVRVASSGENWLSARFTHPVKSNVWAWRDRVYISKQAILLVVPRLVFSGMTPKTYLNSARVAEVGLIHMTPHGTACAYSRRLPSPS